MVVFILFVWVCVSCYFTITTLDSNKEPEWFILSAISLSISAIFLFTAMKYSKSVNKTYDAGFSDGYYQKELELFEDNCKTEGLVIHNGDCVNPKSFIKKPEKKDHKKGE